MKKSCKTLKNDQQIGLRDQRAETEESYYEIVEDIMRRRNYKTPQTMGQDKGSK